MPGDGGLVRPAGTRGTQGRGDAGAASRDDSPAASRIREIFKVQFRHLAALFPVDGETMVNRACAAAIGASRTKPLKDASAESIAASTIACHHLGLEIGDQAYLVPYGGEVQLIIGPRGLITLMYRSGFVKSVVARSVFEADKTGGVWEYDLGSKPYVRHQKAHENRRDGIITHTYAIVETTTEGTTIDVLTREDIAYYRSCSKAKTGPWFDNYEGMCRKTAIKRVAEFVPRSAMLSAALRESDTGAYEIPEEILHAARVKVGGVAEMPPTGEVAPEQTEQRAYPNGATS